MKCPMRWLQDYAPFKASAQEFADRMTMSGTKVETWESEADDMQKVVVGRIDSLTRHPDADTLWVCAVNIGAETLQIVTGADNLKQGDLCPVALHGAKLPGGKEIRRGKLRGLESNGMLCSLEELNLTVNDFPNDVEDGIMVLEEEAELGSPAAAALGMDDTAFDFEITPNRPDCLSVRGVAREAAATFGVPFTAPEPAAPAGKGNVASSLRAGIEADDLCLRYSAAMVENVRIKPSPRWLRERLRLCGVRPINNIVDITNYVMLEYGQPMHAFDFAYVNGGEITVRRARAGESIVTLDDVERKLDEDMMVIADAKGPNAIAGVMGGEHSGVYETTNRVVFESACFNGPCVRQTARRLGMRTESSGRFEKGLDPENAAPALRRALELVVELDAGDIVGGVLDAYPNPAAPREIPFRPEEVNRLLGIECSPAEMEGILTPLGIRVENGKAHLPSWRGDIRLDCDIAEEIARFVGYNKVPMTILRGTASAMPTQRQRFERRMRDVLVGYGFWECKTVSFYSPKQFDRIRLPEGSPLRSPVRVSNPLGEETSVMRTTALPSIMEVAGRNWAAREETAALFEMATTYLPAEEEGALPSEPQTIVLAAYGDEWDTLTMKGAVEGLLATAGVRGSTVQRNSEGASYHPGRCADVLVPVPVEKGRPVDTLVATFGEIHPEVAENYGVRTRLVAAEIRLDVLYAARGGVPQYKPLPRFPALTRDLALIAGMDVPAGEIEAVIRKAGGKRLEKLSLFDVYTGERIAAGTKNLAYSLVLRDASATLTDEDADAVIAKILKKLGEMDVVLRS